MIRSHLPYFDFQAHSRMLLAAWAGSKDAVLEKKKLERTVKERDLIALERDQAKKEMAAKL